MKRRLALIAAITVSAVLSLGIRVPRCAAQATLLEFSDESLGFSQPQPRQTPWAARRSTARHSSRQLVFNQSKLIGTAQEMTTAASRRGCGLS